MPSRDDAITRPECAMTVCRPQQSRICEVPLRSRICTGLAPGSNGIQVEHTTPYSRVLEAI